jgi:hypothetical protein
MMMKRIVSRALALTLILSSSLLPASRSFAHCPGVLGPPDYLETTFAPIRAGAEPIALELVTRGITSPPAAEHGFSTSPDAS